MITRQPAFLPVAPIPDAKLDLAIGEIAVMKGAELAQSFVAKIRRDHESIEP